MTLKYARVKAGKTSIQVATEAGITKQRYNYTEKNGITSTKEDTARKIADAVGVSLFSLCGPDVLKFKPRTAEERSELIALIYENFKELA